ncbi:hypothetical protein PQQ53_23220 [Paraburkholderia strydomiana]|uniref:hypothetical protein n=1 Tax=Paraburkholderia strydomiana TaxID=1245417 RepID=UPI0038B974B9
MVRVVLLGAGASFGSEDATPHTPPLGGGLFGALEASGGVAASLPDDLKAAFRANFEDGMARFYEHSGGNIMAFQRELAHYLAQFRPGPNNTYIRLLETLGIRRVVYCSLNYDILLELAAARLGFDTEYSVSPVARSVRILKLHGSCNFWPDIPVGMFRNSTFSGSGRADIQARIKPLNQDQTIYRCLNEDSVAPAIAMYAKGKAVKVSPDYVEQHQAHWRTVLASARRAVVIGVRVVAEDTHIWDELGKTKAAVTYVGSQAAEPSFLEWKGKFSKNNAYFLESNFSDCINKISQIY